MLRTSKPPSAPIREAHTARESALTQTHAIEALNLTRLMVGSLDGKPAPWSSWLRPSSEGFTSATLTTIEAETHAAATRERATLNVRDQARADLQNAAGDLPKLLAEAEQDSARTCAKRECSAPSRRHDPTSRRRRIDHGRLPLCTAKQRPLPRTRPRENSKTEQPTSARKRSRTRAQRPDR